MQRTYDRTLTSYGVSIGTGLMLESVFEPTEERYDKERDIPVKVDIDVYKKHYYNIYTLARNVITSLTSKAERDTVFLDKKLLDTVMEDINVISTLYQDTKCEPILFVPEYDKVIKHMNIGKEGKINYKDYDIYLYMNKWLKKKQLNLSLDVVHGTYKIHPTLSKTLITTHISIDLLNVNKVPNLFLLESHTGKLKDKTEWYSKYHKIGTKPLSVFPYMEELLYILGDKNFVIPNKLSIRRSLYDLAIEKKWTSHTGKMKVVHDLNSNKLFKELLTGYNKLY